jgi:phenylacetate-CoA ligase
VTFVGELRRLRLASSIDHAARESVLEADETVRREQQLDRLNAVWAHASVQVDRYRELVASGSAPARFDSLEQFAAAVPAVTRAELRDQPNRYRAHDVPADTVRATGGSTGEPLRLAARRREFAGPMADLWAARAWYGVTPASRLFLLWGHAHLFGTGPSGATQRLRRRGADRLLGYERCSAYDLDVATLRDAGARILGHRPDAMVGYSGALDALARVNRDRAADFAALGLRAVIATAEALPRPDSEDVIRTVLGAPVALEYGAAETGVIAHSHPARSGGLQVLSRSNLVEVLPAALGEETGEIVVTSLFRRAVPLLRYRLGDTARPSGASGKGARSDVGVLWGLRGRGSGPLWIAPGVTVHSEVFAHVLRDEPGVLRYQVVLDARGTEPLTELHLVAPSADAGLIERVGARLCAANAGLDRVSVRTVDVLATTVAGKSPIVIDRRQAPTD